MEFRCGDQVIYGIHGVCQICDIEKKRVDHKQVEYYVLRPCSQTDATYYVPMHNAAAVSKMRKMLTVEQLENLLSSDEVLADCWIPEENLRKEQYRKLITRADCAELIGMIRCLRWHKKKQIEAGKKFHICDENFLKDAQRLIAGEVSQILGIEPHQVEEYLSTKLDK